VATLTSLIGRVRVELGDIGKSFVEQFVADGTTNRFVIHYSPVDAQTVLVKSNGVDISSTSYIEESTGILTLPTVPADGTEITVSGTYYRYFTGAEMTSLIEAAVVQHTSGHSDSLGRAVTVDTLPVIDEYPIAVYATTLALYTLATDASFDIDIQAPDGVSIPRSERYRQLMQMVQTRQQQYKELCSMLGLGMYKIEVFTLNRISAATNRLIPSYMPQEVDDKSFPSRIYLDQNTYGNKPPAWPTESGSLTAYQGRSFSTAIDFTGDYWNKLFVANVLTQRGSTQVVQGFTLVVTDHSSRKITAVSRTEGSTSATITAANHGYIAGQSIQINGINTELNSTWLVATVPTTSTFTITTTATTALSLTAQTGATAASGDKSYTATLSLTSDQTWRIAEKTYWSLSALDEGAAEGVEFKGGTFFVTRESTTVL
jgi:hypothetical protein